MEWVGPALSAVALIVVALVEAGAARDRKRVKDQNALFDGVQALLRDRIIQTHNHYMEKEFIPVYGMENVMKMHGAYHALGGNGTVTKLVDDLRKLPTEKKA